MGRKSEKFPVETGISVTLETNEQARALVRWCINKRVIRSRAPQGMGCTVFLFPVSYVPGNLDAPVEHVEPYECESVDEFRELAKSHPDYVSHWSELKPDNTKLIEALEVLKRAADDQRVKTWSVSVDVIPGTEFAEIGINVRFLNSENWGVGE